MYRDYNQAGLDLAYTQSAWAPSIEWVVPWYGVASAAARARLPHIAGISYGDSEAENLDYFPASEQGSPIVIYVHGGAWTDLTKADSAFAAETFVASGVAFVAINFETIPSVRLPEMVGQVQRAITWVHSHASEFGGDPENIHLVGHSSGAHLVAAALTCDANHESTFVRSALCASGAYDLEPVALSHRGRYLNLDQDEIRALSPIANVGRLALPLTIAYGGRESPEFQRQAQAFARVLEEAGRLDGLHFHSQEDHFTLSTSLAHKDGILARTVLERIASDRGQRAQISQTPAP